ncbi:serine kinase [Mycobacterium alsense]|uniref:Serine kinase n=1 Tax=Mycobacterium alsense TaxID=324058 RepID=A0ABX3R331_9MYCO|nr:serine kinase [Mycobacterium alsense]
MGGGVTVVTVSGGNAGAEARGMGLGDALGGAEVSVRGAGAPTVALVDALSPLLMMTAVAMAPTATTMPRIAAAGRQRASAGHASSP